MFGKTESIIQKHHTSTLRFERMKCIISEHYTSTPRFGRMEYIFPEHHAHTPMEKIKCTFQNGIPTL